MCPVVQTLILRPNQQLVFGVAYRPVYYSRIPTRSRVCVEQFCSHQSEHSGVLAQCERQPLALCSLGIRRGGDYPSLFRVSFGCIDYFCSYLLHLPLEMYTDRVFLLQGVDAGLVGLVLSYALSTTSSLNWVVRSVSELETNITSVERIIHQTEVRSEAPEETDTEPHDVWPSHGAIEFKDYKFVRLLPNSYMMC
jgi:hypothetical protein